jgi:hypothetical protein
MQRFLDHRHPQRPPLPQKPLQHLLDSAFRLLRRQLQDPQVLLHRPRRLLLGQRVIGQPEVARRKQVRMVAVVQERARLADQPVDHVPVFDPVLATTPQTRQPLHTLLRVPHLDLLPADPRLHPLPDETARHRVHVALHVNRAATVHTHRPPLARFQPTDRQRTQPTQFLGQTLLAAGVELLEQPSQERLVLRAAGEVPAAAQQQRLLQRALELPMALLTVAVLIGLARLNRLTTQAVVPQQTLVTLGERRSFRPRRYRRRQPIRSVQLRHAAQLPQGVLQPFTETLVALREAHRSRLPVRVRQHEMVDQVIQRQALDGHAQTGAVREVAGAQPPWVMHLVEEHLLRLAVQRTPLLDPTLQRPQLTVRELAGIAALQIHEQRLRLQARVEAEHRLQLRPDRHERIGLGTPVPGHESDLAG